MFWFIFLAIFFLDSFDIFTCNFYFNLKMLMSNQSCSLYQLSLIYTTFVIFSFVHSLMKSVNSLWNFSNRFIIGFHILKLLTLNKIVWGCQEYIFLENWVWKVVLFLSTVNKVSSIIFITSNNMALSISLITFLTCIPFLNKIYHLRIERQYSELECLCYTIRSNFWD